MTRVVRPLIVLLALIVVMGASPALARGSHQLEAMFEEGKGAPPNDDPAALIARGCPAVSEWIFAGKGSGYVTSPHLGLDEAPFDYSFDYCSRWVSFDPERTGGRFVGTADAGLMTITVDEGNVLLVAFRGTWTFDGAPAPPAFTADLHLRYTITGGTGIFEGATGHGQVSLSNTVDALAAVDTMVGVLHGSLHVK